MWVGRATVFVVGLFVILAVVFGSPGTAALAAVPGDPFRLGRTNVIDNMSTLVGNVASPMLKIDNASSDGGATALQGVGQEEGPGLFAAPLLALFPEVRIRHTLGG
jgi:hypothetical protein